MLTKRFVLKTSWLYYF